MTELVVALEGSALARIDAILEKQEAILARQEAILARFAGDHPPAGTPRTPWDKADNRWLTIRELAVETKVPYNTLRNHVAQGSLDQQKPNGLGLAIRRKGSSQHYIVHLGGYQYWADGGRLRKEWFPE